MKERRRIIDEDVYINQRRRSKNVQWVLIPVFMVACLIAGYFFASSSFFALEKVVILGNTQVTDEDIIELAHLDMGMNIFTIDDALLKELLPIEPRIDTVEVKRKWPDTLKIIVTERESVAIVNTGIVIIEIDDQGRILNRSIKIAAQTLPLLTGLDLSGQGVIPGCYLEGEEVASAMTVLTALPADSDIGEINVTDMDAIRIYTVSGVEIRLGDSQDLQEKYLLANTILYDNEAEEQAAIEYIDVSIMEKPVFSYQ